MSIQNPMVSATKYGTKTWRHGANAEVSVVLMQPVQQIDIWSCTYMILPGAYKEHGLDLIKADYQILVSEEDISKTAVTIPFDYVFIFICVP